MIKIILNNHTGELDIETNNVVFYGLYFDTIIEAIGFLVDEIPPNYTYEPYYMCGLRGLFNPDTGYIFINGKWWENREIILKEMYP